MRRIPRPAPATVIAMIALIVAIGGTAYATGEGKPILGGTRNPGSDKSKSLSKETQIIASVSTYGTRQSNKSNNGGGAIYGCRSAAGGSANSQEPCIRANNLSSGLTFEFATTGTSGGLITGKDANSVPFTTTATGVATGLNADRVDSLNADQIVTNARAGLVPLKTMNFVSTTATDANEATARTAATEVPIATFGPFTIYGKCFVDSDGAAGQPEVRTEVYARTSQDGALLDGPTSDTLDGDPAFLTTGTAEDARQVDVTLASGNGATTDMDNAATTLVAPDGSAYEFTISDGAKQGTLAGGNGLWGADNRCGFGFSRFGSS